MLSKPLIAGLLAAGCVTAAAGGAYVAVRHNTAERSATAALEAAAPASDGVEPAGSPVTESEGVIDAQPSTAVEAEAPEERPAEPAPAPPAAAPARRPASRTVSTPVSRSAEARPSRPVPPPAAPAPTRGRVDSDAAPESTAARSAALPSVVEPPMDPTPALKRLPEVPATPELIEVVVPASAVIGLQVERQVSSETAEIEDPVEARVTRDVMAGGQLAIPAGSRVLGSVTAVERGGKVKERAELGVRFHTLVLADGTRLPLRTETITRQGDAVSGESARKIGGAAVGGAILGAILGGGKGAMIGGATGAAGGTAAVMAGDRNPAVLPAGAIVTARLSGPVHVQVEKEQ